MDRAMVAIGAMGAALRASAIRAETARNHYGESLADFCWFGSTDDALHGRQSIHTERHQRAYEAQSPSVQDLPATRVRSLLRGRSDNQDRRHHRGTAGSVQAEQPCTRVFCTQLEKLFDHHGRRRNNATAWMVD